jgi:hypothetical protein
MNHKLAGLSVVLLACSQALAETRTQVDYFTDNAFSNTISTMQHPAGEHYKGVTYLAYQGPLEDPYVAAYDHTTGEWSGPFKAGTSEMGRSRREPARWAKRRARRSTITANRRW